jgi:hypothetical protein
VHGKKKKLGARNFARGTLAAHCTGATIPSWNFCITQLTLSYQ